MDEKSASAAAEKVRTQLIFEFQHLMTLLTLQADAIRVKVGYPVSPNTESAWAIYRYYALVLIDEDKLMENVLSSWYGFFLCLSAYDA